MELVLGGRAASCFDRGERKTAAWRTSSSCTPAMTRPATTNMFAARCGASRREASKVHAQLVIDVQHGRTGPSRTLTVNQLAQRCAQRHFHGTMLLGAGVSLRSVRDRLGHSSVMVADIYVDGRWDGISGRPRSWAPFSMPAPQRRNPTIITVRFEDIVALVSATAWLRRGLRGTHREAARRAVCVRSVETNVDFARGAWAHATTRAPREGVTSSTRANQE
ncbi:MAG: hypothetical protein QOJ67_1937 [Acidimicrobiaceae bacterium]